MVFIEISGKSISSLERTCLERNILITGARGQLGRELSKLMKVAVKTGSQGLDITDSVAVKDFVKEYNIQLIINCAAYTAVDKAVDEKELAEKVNVIGPKNLAQTGAAVVHISTDYVFDGKNYRPYEEDDAANPISFYGKTKKMGESAVLEYADTALVIRTAWLYSSHGNNFVKTIRMLGQSRNHIEVVDDQVGTPTFAGDLAAAIVKIIPQIRKGQKDIYHFTNEGVCSWYDFAKEIVALSNVDCTVNPISLKDYGFKELRPFYCILSKEKIRKDFGLKIPHWKDGLVRCLTEL